MSGSLPTPRDPVQRYLAAIHDRLGDVEGRLGELLDRFSAAPSVVPEGQVELREPAGAPSGEEGAAAAPKSGDGGRSGVKARRPARTPTAARSRAAKKPVKEPAAKRPQAKPAAAPKPTKPTPKKPEDT